MIAKLCPRADCAAHAAVLPRPVVFTNGVFDLLHRGHVSYLQRARSLGASLVVGVNTDASVRRLGKGAERPLNNEQDRALVLAALESVSLVTWFDEDTPLALITEIAPDILVKGADYRLENIVGAEQVLQRGGRVERIEFEAGYSTTALVQKILRAGGA